MFGKVHRSEVPSIQILSRDVQITLTINPSTHPFTVKRLGRGGGGYLPRQVEDGAVAVPGIFYQVDVLQALQRSQDVLRQEHELVAVQLPAQGFD